MLGDQARILAFNMSLLIYDCDLMQNRDDINCAFETSRHGANYKVIDTLLRILQINCYERLVRKT